MKKKGLVITALSLLAIGLTGCRVQFHTGNKSAGAKVVKTLTTQKFTSVKTNLQVADLEIKNGKEFKVIYHGHKNIVPTVSVKNGQLTVTQKASGNFAGTERVTIVVPEKLDNINIQADEGDIDISKLSVTSGQIKSDEGDIKIRRLETKNKFNIDADEGDVDITYLAMENGFEIRSDEGDVNIDRVEASGYDLVADEGDITVNGNDHSGDDSSYYRKNIDTKNVLKVRADEGDIDLD